MLLLLVFRILQSFNFVLVRSILDAIFGESTCYQVLDDSDAVRFLYVIKYSLFFHGWYLEL